MTPATTTVEVALVDGVDVDAVARAVRACAGVSDLYSGRFGEIGSYLPGRRIVGGVQVDDDTVTVQITTRWGYTTRDLLAQVSRVTATLRHGRTLNLVVADIEDDMSTPPMSTPALSARTPVSGSPVALAAADIHPSLPESSSS